MPHRLRIAVLCRVIDNLGDAGVCWRLCRQLAHEHDCVISLHIDDRSALAQVLAGAADPTKSDGIGDDGSASVEIADWPADDCPLPPLDALICAFACEPPAAWRAGLGPATAPGRRPLWINVDHLSAEDWIDSVHGLTSIKPSDAAVEHYFMPGFTPASGGLLRVSALPASWLDSAPATPPGPRPHGPRLSLFCYPDEELLGWFDLLSRSAGPIELRVPEGVARAPLARFLGEPLEAGRPIQRGALTVSALPWFSQPGYDALLRDSELNFVRGEDSWIRAHWAGRPFIWQPYPQEQATRLLKLDAWLDRLTADWPAHEAGLVRRMMHAWSRDGSIESAWPDFAAWLFGPAGQADSGWRRFSAVLAAQTDLATRLVRFISDRL